MARRNGGGRRPRRVGPRAEAERPPPPTGRLPWPRARLPRMTGPAAQDPHVQIHGSGGWETRRVAVVTGAGLDPREPTLICSKFTVPVTGMRHRPVLWGPRVPARAPPSRFCAVPGADQQGAPESKDWEARMGGTSTVFAAGLSPRCVHRGEGGTFLFPCPQSSPPTGPTVPGPGEAELPVRAHSSHASCPLGPAGWDRAGGWDRWAG